MRFKKLSGVSIFSLLLIIAMTIPVFATGRVMSVGNTGCVQSPTKAVGISSKWRGSQLYLGENNGSTILWDILDADRASDGTGDGMFLLSDKVLATGVKYNSAGGIGDNVEYTGSNLFAVEEGIYNAQAEEVRNAIIPTTMTSQGKYAGVYGGAPSDYYTEAMTDAHFFAPSVRELDSADYGFYSLGGGYKASDDGQSNLGSISRVSDRSTQNGFWTRSMHSELIYGTNYAAGRVATVGVITPKPVTDSYDVVTACNLSKDSIMYLIDANISKGGDFKKISATSGSVARCGIKDSGNGKVTVSKYETSGSYITLHVSSYPQMSRTGNNQISGALADSNGNIVAYGKIGSHGDQTIKVKLPEGLSGKYNLYVFEENLGDRSNSECYVSEVWGLTSAEEIKVENGVFKLLKNPKDTEGNVGDDVEMYVKAENAESFTWMYAKSKKDSAKWNTVDADAPFDYKVSLSSSGMVSTIHLYDIETTLGNYYFKCLMDDSNGDEHYSKTANVKVNKTSSSSTASSSSSMYSKFVTDRTGDIPGTITVPGGKASSSSAKKNSSSSSSSSSSKSSSSTVKAEGMSENNNERTSYFNEVFDRAEEWADDWFFPEDEDAAQEETVDEPSTAFAGMENEDIMTGETEKRKGILGEVSLIIFLLSVLMYIIYAFATYALFMKAGETGYYAFIPIYNMVVLARIVMGSGIWALLLLVPVASIYFMYRFARAYGKGILFTVGLVLLFPVFYLILGFGHSDYLG